MPTQDRAKKGEDGYLGCLDRHCTRRPSDVTATATGRRSGAFQGATVRAVYGRGR